MHNKLPPVPPKDKVCNEGGGARYAFVLHRPALLQGHPGSAMTTTHKLTELFRAIAAGDLENATELAPHAADAKLESSNSDAASAWPPLRRGLCLDVTRRRAGR